MSTTMHETVPSVDAMIEQVRQLSDADLDAVLDAALVTAINRSLADEVLEHHNKLQAGLRTNILAEAEYTELLRLVDTVEPHNARRIRCLAELADLRKTTLEALRALPEFGVHFDNLAPGLESGKRGGVHNVE